MLYLVQLFDPIARFSEWLGDFRQGLAALGKLVGLLETENAVAERPGAGASRRGRRTDRRHFGYDPDAPVVDEVSLRLETGEQVALVGVTGAGK